MAALARLTRTVHPLGYSIAVDRILDRVETAADRWNLDLREAEVLALLIAGNTAPEVAARLDMHLQTVKWRVRCLLAKSHTRNRAELVAAACLENART